MKLQRLSVQVISVLITAFAGPAYARQEAAAADQAITFPAFTPRAGQPVCLASEGYAAETGGRRTFIWRPQWLGVINPENRSRSRILRSIVSAADAAMTVAPPTVTDKTMLPESGDRHDYMSMGPYWWPDPASPSGLPYIRRDGQFNPERNGSDFDVSDLNTLNENVTALALAWHHTGERRYAERAALYLRTWFLHPATRMNPNFTHAQSIPGRVAGRAEGVIDAHRLTPIVESIGLLAPSGALSAEEIKGLERWFGELTTWLLTSTNGIEERAAENNHGIYFDLLTAHFALFARREDVARNIIEGFPASRIANQFAPKGTLPEELERTRSWHYSHWTMIATFKLAGLGECLGLDLWNARTADGRGLRPVIDWLASYAGREDSWPYPETAFQPGSSRNSAMDIALEDFRLAAWGYQDQRLEALASAYQAQRPSSASLTWLTPLP